MRENRGTCPADAKGKRIRGMLRNGRRFGFEDAGGAPEPAWAADTTDWRLTGHAFDVMEFEVIG